MNTDKMVDKLRDDMFKSIDKIHEEVLSEFNNFCNKGLIISFVIMLLGLIMVLIT